MARQGWHHVAEKSTNTGMLDLSTYESKLTSFTLITFSPLIIGLASPVTPGWLRNRLVP